MTGRSKFRNAGLDLPSVMDLTILTDGWILISKIDASDQAFFSDFETCCCFDRENWETELFSTVSHLKPKFAILLPNQIQKLYKHLNYWFRGRGIGDAGGAIAPPTFGILLRMHDLAPPTFCADPFTTAPSIFHTFHRLCIHFHLWKYVDV